MPPQEQAGFSSLGFLAKALLYMTIGALAALAAFGRVFGEDVTRCPQCGDHLRVLAFLFGPRLNRYS